LWRAALALAQDGYLKLEQGHYTEEIGEQLQQAIGRAEMCAGWLAFDAGQHEIARSSFNEALSLARQAGNPVIETHALCNLAFQSNFLGMPRQALRFADAADRISAGAVPRVRVVLGMRRATSYALMGDRSASDRAIGEARTFLDREADKPTVEWCAFVTPAEVDGVDGTRLLHLGRAKEDEALMRSAESVLGSSISAHAPGFARNRALYRVRLASGQMALGSVSQAAISAVGALDELNDELSSSVVTAELAEVAESMLPHRRVSEVDHFLDRYRVVRSPRNQIGEEGMQ
jgi:hypothetical protein